MTRIYIHISEPLFMIEFNGHATGSQEVCSGISSLMFSLEGFLRNNESLLTEHLAKIPEDNTDAETYIRFESTSEKVRGAFDLVVIGLLQIERSYQKYCKVTFV